MESNGRGQKRKREQMERSDSEDEGQNVDQGLPSKKRMIDVEIKKPLLSPRDKINKWMMKNLADESETKTTETQTAATGAIVTEQISSPVSLSPEAMDITDFEPPRLFIASRRTIFDSRSRPSTSTGYFGAHDVYGVFVPSSCGSSLTKMTEEEESFENTSGGSTETAVEEAMEEDEKMDVD
ncbi:hypothetical protein TNCT_71371 [Trichonephila clavata]|uniref:Uncharacterized protein n=1 Tax=Trichonephila clavata TaxID=2740835 RepID=A0A8X6GRW8_TRICU|nr:hypothetical protein TNCT_71371 [Trichonephila clavata]